MNIKITHNWLLDYLDTDATPYEIQKYLSLSGPSIERVDKTPEGDYVYDIEITSNRIDTASVFGIALEAQAILPLFGKRARLKFNPLEKYSFATLAGKGEEELKVEIRDPALCSRFSAIMLDNLEVKESPDFIRERLKAIDIKVINNVVDISNYLMVSFGQPTHVFDFDKIGKQTMIMRESRKGEEIVTLDGKKVTLPGGDIVIEDGNGDLIDLCGIMGGLNSSFTRDTKRVLLFVQTYNKQKIRRTSMLTGQRTIAATYFEKGLDEERVEATLAYGAELIGTYASGRIASPVVDIYGKKYTPKHIVFTLEDINRKIGVEIAREKVEHIITALGFSFSEKNGTYDVLVPSFRQYDVEILEDIVEEVARIYGYHNLPNNLSPAVYVKQPPEMERLFVYQSKIKTYLKHLGMHEVLNYSMISKEMIEAMGLKPESHLYLSNVLSEEIKYLRTTLIPSLLKNVKTNEGKREELRLFEVAKTYTPREGDLPVEKYQVALVSTASFADLKGIAEGLLHELHIEKYAFRASDSPWYAQNAQAQLFIGETAVGTLGQVKATTLDRFGIKSNVFAAEFGFESLVAWARTISSYKPPHPYAIIKLDKTYETAPANTYADIREKAFKASPLLKDMEVVDIFKNRITVRYYFASPDRNITEEEAKAELTKMS